MARRKFGSSADYVVSLGASNVATLEPGVDIKFYNLISGGSQYTDLTQLNGTAISSGVVTTDDTGAIPEFLGPDNVTVLYADGSGDGTGPRRAITPTDLGATVVALDTQVNAVGGIDDRVETLETFMGSGSAKERPWEVVVAGTSDAAVQTAIGEVMASAASGVIPKTLVFPPGDYHLTTPLITTLSTNSQMLMGFTIKGAGKRKTRIYWDNAGTAPWITAYRRFRFLTISGMTVTSGNANNEFIYSWSDTDFPGNYNQAWRLFDLEFTGPWKRVFGLDGDSNANLNSEMKFSSIFTATDCVFSDGFFVSGVGLVGGFVNAQNQFLNYWFSDCVLNIKSGTMFKLNKGGSLTLENSSCSCVDSSNGPVTYFSMPNQNSNNPVVNRLSCRHVYFEPKRSDHKVIDCSWAGGTVSFESCCDEGPLQDDPNQATYVIHRYVGANIWAFGAVGPSVRYVNHVGAGCIQYEGPAQGRGGFVIEGGNWYRGPTGQPVNPTQLQGTDPILKWTSGAPRYALRNGYNYTPTATSGW